MSIVYKPIKPYCGICPAYDVCKDRGNCFMYAHMVHYNSLMKCADRLSNIRKSVSLKEDLCNYCEYRFSCDRSDTTSCDIFKSLKRYRSEIRRGVK